MTGAAPQLDIVGGTVLGDTRPSVVSARVAGGRLEPVQPDEAPRSDVPVLDATDLLVSPGLVDVQVNGAHGVDLASEPERIWAVGAALPRYGVTAFLPTIVSAPASTYSRAQDTMAAGPPPDYAGALPIGLHFEGPMLAAARRGAHDQRWIRHPRAVSTERWSRARHVRMVTLAPELHGSLDAITALRESGVVVALGHSDATAEQAEAALAAGASVGTHLFNAMGPLHHREPGLAGALLVHPDCYVTAIADGAHVHPRALELAWLCKGPTRLILVTDATAGMGAEPGSYSLGSIEVQTTTDHGSAENADGRLAGSTTPLDSAVRNLMEAVQCDLAAALATATRSPATMLGLEEHGSLAAGTRADLTLLDGEHRPTVTIVGGRVVHDPEQRLHAAVRQ